MMPAEVYSMDGLQAENERLKQAVGELSVLNEIVTAIGTHRKVEQINKLILSICIRHFGVEQGVIHLLDPADSADILKTGVRVRKPSPDSGNGKYRLGLTLTGWLLKHKQPLRSDRLADDSRFPGAANETPHVRSVLAVPLKVHDKMLGILSLFNKRDEAPWSESDQRLLGIIGLQAAQVIESARLYDMEEDLRAARSIQERLLPGSAPELRGLDLYGTAVPALNVGGDFYDWLPLPGGKLGCMVADVSGKGMPAALLMAQLQAAFRSQTEIGESPDRLVNEVNRIFGRTVAPDRFVTLVYVVVDPASGTLTYANAGHNPPLLWRKDGNSEWLSEGGLILGRVSASVNYESYSVPFEAGDGLVVYTDGVTEAHTSSGEEFGVAGLEQCVRKSSHKSAAELGHCIRQSLERHLGGHKQSDDVTYTVISRPAGTA
jgi:sigma-B regulation protein RsbU (phosphoserine phosphatase)